MESEMNYVYGLTALMALVCAALLAMLGISYANPEVGHGLHPVIAGVGMLVLFLVGFWASWQIQD